MKVREVFADWYVENAGRRLADYFADTGVLDRHVVRIAKNGYSQAIVFDGPPIIPGKGTSPGKFVLGNTLAFTT